MVVGLVVGVIVSVFQAMTQVHDQTLSFIPKILAMVTVILVLLPWFLKVMEGYTRTVFDLVLIRRGALDGTQIAIMRSSCMKI